jgi:hypothetical protein
LRQIVPDLTARQLKRILDLHARVMGGSTPQEREAAWKKLDAYLRALGKTWNDIAALIAEATPAAPYVDPRNAGPPKSYPDVTPLDTIRHLLERYISLKPHEHAAIALWIIHTHIYERFMVTPRLALISPVHDCGKTTALDVINLLGARTEKVDSTTAAAIYHAADERRTQLLDEGDNLELSARAAARAVFNSGYRRGGGVTRMVGGRRRRFSTFAPIAIASIGSLPLPQMSRSVVIHMERYTGAEPLKRFDSNDREDLDAVYRHIAAWVRDADINLDPEMPAEVRGRFADNWRPLIAIADACGPAWGALARKAAITFGRDHQDEDLIVMLLRDIRTVFDALKTDRLPSKALVTELNAMDDAPWSEWRGLRDSRPPRPLSQGELARLLRDSFRIRPQSIWPLHREPEDKSSKGYMRSQFEAAWAGYCSSPGTPAQPPAVKHLRAV